VSDSHGFPVFPPGTENRRPADVRQLLCDHDVRLTFSNSARQNRFYVVNLVTVLDILELKHTQAGTYFDEAEEIIKNQTDWTKQLNFIEFKSHHVHINNSKRLEAKYFGHAVTIIVAMEVAALRLGKSCNVYDFLRVLPAMHYADRFDAHRLATLKQKYSEMLSDERARKFGPDQSSYSFERLCLAAMIQPHSTGLLEKMTEGYCVTRYTAERLVRFVNENFDEELHVGPVVVSGGESVSRNLGTRAAAPELRVPKTLDQIDPCS